MQVLDNDCTVYGLEDGTSDVWFGAGDVCFGRWNQWGQDGFGFCVINMIKIKFGQASVVITVQPSVQ